MTRILLVEDDQSIIDNLAAFLRQEGFTVDAVGGQKAALRQLEHSSYDLLLLDVSLSDGSGFAVCAAVKANGDTPVIFLTAADDEYSVVTGLEIGGDDYIAKPFRPRELISRIKNVLRRRQRQGTSISCGNVVVDTQRGVASKNGRELFLSALEYRLLLYFFSNKGVVLSRRRLLDEIWDIAGELVNDNTLTVYIKRLRDKIEDDPQNPRIIRTIRGLGYKVED